jgi:fused signal recognition particle receptor
VEQDWGYAFAIVGFLLLCGTVAASAGLAAFLRSTAPAPARVAEPEVAELEAAATEAAAVAPVRAAPDMRSGLARTRQALLGRIEGLFGGGGALEPAALEELERVLFAADLGVRTADSLLDAARAANGAQDVRAALAECARSILASVRAPDPKRGHPHVVLVVGVNGSGKTTSIAKLARRYKDEGESVLLAAADTFRAAAIDQLAIWAERAGAEFVRGQPGGDPAAVAFDAVKAARARSIDVVLIDTAGRLQTDTALMEELEKIARVIKKEIPEAPHEVLLVLDANTGQNAIRQAQEFGRVVSVDRILLAKLDGTAKGGVILGIAQEVGLPVRYVGVGEEIEDLADFDEAAFVESVFGEFGA